MVEENNSITIIKNTPCLKCSQCGEVFYTDEVAKKIEHILDYTKSAITNELLIIEYENALIQTKQFAEQNHELFINEIIAVYKKYGLSLSHEDAQGGFIIEKYKDENINWLRESLIESDAQCQ